MKKILLPLILLLVGVGGGIGAGLFLFPPTHEDPALAECAPATDVHGEEEHPVAEAPPPGGSEDQPAREYARLNNQFVVPVVAGGKVSALVVLSLSIEVVTGSREIVFQTEPKLRDEFLQVLFDHANLGGFDGAFTSSQNMRSLREALREAAQSTLGSQVTDVLIIDIVRQDV